MRLGHNMQHALIHYGNYAQSETTESYYGFAHKDPATKMAIGKLVKLGLLELCPDVLDMAKITQKGWQVFKEIRNL